MNDLSSPAYIARNLPNEVKVIDTTLREGNQAPGVRFDARQAMDIARLLERVGVDMIECGHPAVGEEEQRRIAALAGMSLSVPLLAHARACDQDVFAVQQSGATWVGIFCGVNRISRMSRLGGRSQDSVIDMIRRSVAYAKELGLHVRYTLEDATRTPIELVTQALSAAVAEGADRICYADTLGAIEPLAFGEAIHLIREAIPSVDLEIHVHDDRGFAMANTWMALEEGASWVSASVNGLGERCGITDLALLLANLEIAGSRPLQDPQSLQHLSRYVGAISRSAPDARRPIVGRNAFTHTARLHTQAVLKTPLAYAIFDATRLGRDVRIAPDYERPQIEASMVVPPVICATELRYHRAGPGQRHVMIDERFVRDARQYCIVREIPPQSEPAPAHVDAHRHICDSLFMFIGSDPGLKGLDVEVMLEGQTRQLASPAAIFIPAGTTHSYRVLGGHGYFVNHVLHGEYNDSLLEAEPAPSRAPAETLERRPEASVDNPDSRIRDFLAQAAGVSRTALNDELDLLETGVLDSLRLLELFSLIEELTGNSLEPDQMSEDAVRTIRSIRARFAVQPAHS